MDWIKRKLGITDLIDQQKQTNKLLKEVIKWQKHNINNDCEPPSRKRKA
jgi:hypothetical protein